MKRPKNIAKFIIAILLLLIVIGCFSCKSKPDNKCLLDVENSFIDSKSYYRPNGDGFSVFVVKEDNLYEVHCDNLTNDNISKIEKLIKVN